MEPPFDRLLELPKRVSSAIPDRDWCIEAIVVGLVILPHDVDVQEVDEVQESAPRRSSGCRSHQEGVVDVAPVQRTQDGEVVEDVHQEVEHVHQEVVDEVQE